MRAADKKRLDYHLQWPKRTSRTTQQSWQRCAHMLTFLADLRIGEVPRRIALLGAMADTHRLEESCELLTQRAVRVNFARAPRELSRKRRPIFGSSASEPKSDETVQQHCRHENGDCKRSHNHHARELWKTTRSVYTLAD